MKRRGTVDDGTAAEALARTQRAPCRSGTLLLMTERPIACSLGADALRSRRTGLLAELLGLVEAREELPEGLRLRFAPTTETLSMIAAAVEAERQCCRFLRFAVVVEPYGGSIVLEFTGPPGTRDFLSALLER